MAPEQIRGQVDRRTDIFAAAVCLWEALTGRRLHEGLKDVEIVTRIVAGKFPAPSTFAPDVSPALDQIVLRGLVPDPKKRFSTAKEMALEIENNVGLATPTEVSAFVERLASEQLKKRQEKLSAMEIAAADLIPDEAQLPPPSLALPSGGDPFAPQSLGQEAPNPETLTQTTTAGAALMSDVPAADAPPPRKVPVQWIVLGACALLAIVGASLGGYAIVARKTQAGPAVTPTVTEPLPSAIPVPQPSSSAIQVEAHVDAGAAPVESAPVRETTPAPSASVAPKASASAAPSAKPTSTATSKRKGCEQPFTTDATGKRKLKPECIDQL
jgi:serine/threonine-protein kinase